MVQGFLMIYSILAALLEKAKRMATEISRTFQIIEPGGELDLHEESYSKITYAAAAVLINTLVGTMKNFWKKLALRITAMFSNGLGLYFIILQYVFLSSLAGVKGN